MGEEKAVDFKVVVVGVDGSEAAAAAVRWAADAVGDGGGEVVAVHAFEAFAIPRQAAQAAGRGLGILSSGVTTWKEEAGRALNQQWSQPLLEAGVSYRTVLAEAEPVPALLDTARRENADLIVVGHEGKTGFLHQLFRGLSEQLIHHAQRPIVVVPSRPSSSPPEQDVPPPQ